MFTVTGSPVTNSGTLTATLASQTAKTVLAAPNGGDGVPSFRTLLTSDISSGIFVAERVGGGVATSGNVLIAAGAGSSASWGQLAHSSLSGKDYASSGHTGFAGLDVQNSFTAYNTINFSRAGSALYVVNPNALGTGVLASGTLSDLSAGGSGIIWLTEKASSPGTQGSGQLYGKTDGKIYYKSSSGTEWDLTSTGAGGGVTSLAEGSLIDISSTTGAITVSVDLTELVTSASAVTSDFIPWMNAGNTTQNKMLISTLQTLINPDLSGYVTLTTTQTISGAKTFTSNGKFERSGASIIINDTSGSSSSNGIFLQNNASSTFNVGYNNSSGYAYLSTSSDISLSAGGEKLRVLTSGQILLNSYTVSNFVATPDSFLGVDSSGYVVKTSSILPSKGGTGISSYTLGDMLYASGSSTLIKLSGNTSSTKQFLSQTGTGTVSAAPAWVTLAKLDVGLSNVDNTSDLNKPISTATQTALNLKANIASPVFTGNVTGLGVATGTSFNSITGLASVAPLMDGVAAVGTSTLVARQDHVHPTDTSRAATNGNITQAFNALNYSLPNNYSMQSNAGSIFFWNGSGSMATLTSAGALSVTSTMTATNFILSDLRLKTNINKLDTLDWVDSIDFYSFNMRTDTKVKRYGVIAQELEEINSNLVVEGIDGMKAVNYIDLLVAKVARLEQKIKELENGKCTK